MRETSQLFAVLLFAASALSGCLPGDTRPEPGRIFTTVTGSQATREGVETADGWSLAFDRVLLGAGPMQFGDACDKYAEYSEPGYRRVLEVTAPDPQKLAIMFGTGTCDLDFQVSPPNELAVLSAGVSEADKTLMRTRGSDAYVPTDGVPVGVTLRVEGSATRGARSARFGWSIRQSLFYVECKASIDGRIEPGVMDLRGGEQRDYNLLIETEALFRDTVDRTAAVLRFAPFADADSFPGNADGDVTLEELAGVPLDDLRAWGPYSGSALDPDGEEGTDEAPPVVSLADYVYLVLFPTFLRYRDTGDCKVSLKED